MPYPPPPSPLPFPPPPSPPAPPSPRPPTIDVEWNDGATIRGNANMQLLDDKFDALAKIAGPITFPANSNSACSSSDPNCGSDGICKPCVNLAESHDTCSLSPDTFTKGADGTITSKFSASVAGATGGCCTANSCVGAYFESQPASLTAGDKVYFDYQAFAGDDWFEVGVGLYTDDGTLKQGKVFRGKAMDSFTNDYFAIPGAGNYKLGFYVGSYDRTGGSALGATLKVKKFQMTGPADEGSIFERIFGARKQQQQQQQGQQGQQAQGRPFQTTDAFKELAEAQAKKRAECKSDTICRCKIFAEGCAATGLETGPSDRYPLHSPATYCKEYGLCGDDLPEHLREPTEVSLLNLRIPAGDK
jgi:hypothetical protein